MGRTQSTASFLPSASSISFHQNPEEKCISFLKFTTHIHQFNQILAYLFTNGLKNSSFLATKLVDFCSSTNRMQVASSIFRQIPHPSSFLWTAMIRGFSQNGPHRLSILFFYEMRCQGTNPNHLTYPFVLKACSSVLAILEGKQIHAQILKTGFLSDVYIRNSILDLYVKCESIRDACVVYDEMPERDFVSHTSIISGYFGVGDSVSARLVFDVVKGTDVVLWSAMIAGYAQNGEPGEVLALFEQMQSLGVKPNSVTMVSVVSACTQMGDSERGKWAHDFMVRSGMEMNMIVCTSLLDMYIKGEFINEAREMFNRMPQRDVVSWNSLINGYAKNGYANEALEVFREMQDSGVEPNKVTFCSVLSSCAQLGAIAKGREIDYLLEEMGMVSDLSVGTALLDMYAKCGCLMDARQVFNRIYPRDVVMWSTMINGFALNGHYQEVISLFGRMFKEGVQPNEVTYLGILTACSHGGMIDEGRRHFSSMIRHHCIQPGMEHYACMVDLLCRAGQIDEGKRFIEEMPIEPSASVWGSLLGACATHKNIQIGEYAARHLIELEPDNDLIYVFLSNIYAGASRWKDVENVRMNMRCSGTRKTPGCSWIEVEDKIHEFLVGDRTNPLYPQTYRILDCLSKQLRLIEDFPFQETFNTFG
ncbi:pentatricopeptide repeat-containing protein At1g08070, chloroplastic-like [Magnolia sinica]|uniref:pentatricopeptide repeat-containing protein At1g08070, chloroplastic-like n=1 Tax=Magnolia sinica TaxID=86752 RepID=UPI0026588C1D|nr:pentatricopeptide repeat-containing protein At1g08070, chloroplastic-like [Magnolia sinica]